MPITFDAELMRSRRTIKDPHLPIGERAGAISLATRRVDVNHLAHVNVPVTRVAPLGSLQTGLADWPVSTLEATSRFRPLGG